MFLNRLVIAVAIALATFSLTPNGFAQEVYPIAIRHWPNGGITIETHWGLQAGMGLSAEQKSSFDSPIDLDVSAMPSATSQSVSRAPNADEPELKNDSINFTNRNAISVIRAPLADKNKATPETPNVTVVFTHGVLVVNMNEVDAASFNKAIESEFVRKEFGELGEEFGVSPVVIANHASHDEAFCGKVVDLLNPRMLIVNDAVSKVGDADVEATTHNTVAVTRLTPTFKDKKFVSLGTEPYEMSDEVAELFSKKEAAQKESREMFAKLSVEQMNFKTSNGSHTPRWNAEHMMGRELGFFSEIYNAVDPSIPVMNLNPKQMPKDYKFAHADWTGAEEARQMKRVEDFTRRFAYLLDRMDLDKKAKGSRFWTPRKLLKQMERHYNEHSANVIKKMKLEGWPKSELETSSKESE